jgi:hypothetical protein
VEDKGVKYRDTTAECYSFNQFPSMYHITIMYNCDEKLIPVHSLNHSIVELLF